MSGKYPLGQTSRLTSEKTTRLQAKEWSVLHKEKERIESAWLEMRQKCESRFSPLFFYDENKPLAASSQLQIAVDSPQNIAAFMRDQLLDRALYLEASEFLNETIYSVMGSCRRICNLIYHTYGGLGEVEMRSSRSFHFQKLKSKAVKLGALPNRMGLPELQQELIPSKIAAWIITQSGDRSIFYLALATARKLYALRLTAEKDLAQKRESLEEAIEELLSAQL